MSKYKIVFIDIDGTLINGKEKITYFTKKVLTKLKELGIIVVVISGRNAYQVKQISQEANASNFIIASNGAEVYDYANDIEIYRDSIPLSTLTSVYDFCNTHNLKVYFNSKYQRYINVKDEHPFPENHLISSLDEITDPVSQIVIQSTNYNRMLVLKDYFQSINPELNNVNSSYSLLNNTHIPNEHLFRDFTLKQNSKSNGVIKLLDYLHLEPSEAISVGDGLNDLSMLELTGLSIAMDNACQELKNVADKITLTNDENGVAIILKEIFKID